jgi:hypothetical protein
MTTFGKATALAVALLIGAAAPARTPTASPPLNIHDIAWSVSEAKGRDVQFSYERGHDSFSLDPDRSELAELRAALDRPAGDVAFTVAREAGTLSCRGTLDRPFDGVGTCDFAGDPRFVEALASRHLRPEHRADLLAMALVDANLALIDGLSANGLPARNTGDVIAAAALHLTPEYVGSLASAGLEMKSIDDAIACRALGIDGEYVRGIIAAGYAASTREIIAMKATGVTPEYARKMNAAAGE